MNETPLYQHFENTIVSNYVICGAIFVGNVVKCTVW